MIGSGGTILALPIFVYLFGIKNMQTATHYTMFVVGVTAFIGAYRKYQENMVDIKTAINFLIPSLLSLFFTEKWQQYSSLNHHYTSLPHEQDFFAFYYLKERKIIPENAVVMNGFCQDIHAGSFMEEKIKFDLRNHIFEKHAINPPLADYENSWDGYREWLIKNRLSKFIINSVRVYEYFGLDFYLPFWQKDWIEFWYSLKKEQLQHQQFYLEYLFSGIFKKYKIDIKIV